MVKFFLAWLTIVTLTFPSIAFAALPPTRSGGQSDNLSTTFDFRAPYSQVTKTSGTGALFELDGYNVLKNPRFEAATYSSNWTASGGTLAAATSTNIFFSKGATWDSNGAGQTLTSDAITVPEGFKGNDCEASIYVKVPSGTETILLQAWDGANPLASADVVNSTYFRKNTVTFPCPTSGTIALRLISVAADEPLIAIDEAYLGLARNVGVADLTTETASYALAWTASSVNPTISNGTLDGVWRRDGDRMMAEIAVTFGSSTSAGTGDYYFSIPSQCTPDTAKMAPDGPATLNFNAGFGLFYDAGSSANARTGVAIYTPSLAGIVRLYITGAGTVGSATTGMGGAGDQINLSINIPCVGWPASQVVMPDAQGLSWSGYHDANCIWTTTSTSYADPSDDASCTLSERTNRNFGTVVTYGAAKPGITFTPRKSGTYFVCARSALYNSTVNGYSTMALNTTGGTTATIGTGGIRQGTSSGSNDEKSVTLCGLVNLSSATSTTVRLQIAASTGTTTLADLSSGGTSVEWSIFNVDQPVNAMLANSVISRDAVGGQVTTINTVVSKSSAYTATANDETILADATSAWTLSLPAAASVKGKKYNIQISAGSDILTIDPNSTETVCGQSTIKLVNVRDGITIQSDGTNWVGLDGACYRSVSGAYSAGTSCGTSDIQGSWVQSCTRNGAGDYTVTFKSGVFSVRPHCMLTSGASTGTNGTHASFVAAPTSSSMQFILSDESGAAVDVYFSFLCLGPR